MKSLQENLHDALLLMAESRQRKDVTHRTRGVRPSRIRHQQEHTVIFRYTRLQSFNRDLTLLQSNNNETLRASIKRGLKKCFDERTKNSDKMAEWLLYVDELEARGLTDLLP
jgi:hypothetical protein